MIERLLRDIERVYSAEEPAQAEFLNLLDRIVPLLERMPHLLQCEEACKVWGEKTDWLTPTIQGYELCMHRADVLHKRCADAASHMKAQAVEIERLRNKKPTV